MCRCGHGLVVDPMTLQVYSNLNDWIILGSGCAWFCSSLFSLTRAAMYFLYVLKHL